MNPFTIILKDVIKKESCCVVPSAYISVVKSLTTHYLLYDADQLKTSIGVTGGQTNNKCGSRGAARAAKSLRWSVK